MNEWDLIPVKWVMLDELRQIYGLPPMQPDYQPPLETVCRTCGGKSIGSCDKQECKSGR